MAASWTEEDRGFETPCYVWQGATDDQGYPVIYRGNKKHLAHRWFYVEERGPEPLPLHHRCEVKLCVRPSHMKPLTTAEHNALHKFAQPGEDKSRCRHGHDLTGDNLIVTGKQRRCRVCYAAAKRRYEAKRRLSSHATVKGDA